MINQEIIDFANKLADLSTIIAKKYFRSAENGEVEKEIAEEALNNNVVRMLETGEMPPLNLPKIRKNPIIEIIPINRGCLSACTFCKTKSARGNLQSYPIEDIVSLENLLEAWKEFLSGKRNKKDVQKAVRKILGNRVKSEAHKKTHFDNAADALAVALTHAMILRGGE